MKNPFDITQYSNNLTLKSDINLSGLGVSGINAIFNFIIKEVTIRQEAIRAAYINGITSEQPFFTNVNSIIWDSPESITNSCFIVTNAIKQFYKSGDGFWNAFATVPCDQTNVVVAGFFHLQNGSDFKEGYVENLSDLGLLQTVTDLFFNPPLFGSDANDFVSQFGAWANSAIMILNKLRYIHRKLVYEFPVLGCANDFNGCSLVPFYAEGANENSPIEIIFDVRDALVCYENDTSYGLLCIAWNSLFSSSRLYILKTKIDGDPALTGNIRKPLFGFSGVDMSGSVSTCATGTNTGYCDSAYYQTETTSNNVSNVNGHPKFASGGITFDCPSSAIVVDSTCIDTLYNDPPSSWRNGQGTSDYVCVRIDSSMFSIDSGTEWDYKIRIVIFNNCSSTGSNDSTWALALSCLGCNCLTDFCGGTDVIPTSSFSSESSSSSSGSLPVMTIIQNVTVLRSGSNEAATSYPSRTSPGLFRVIPEVGVFNNTPFRFMVLPDGSPDLFFEESWGINENKPFEFLIDLPVNVLPGDKFFCNYDLSNNQEFGLLWVLLNTA